MDQLATESTSLYDRLGGARVLRAAVDAFYERVLDDPVLSPFFAATDMPHLRQRQLQFLTQMMGGPRLYRGPAMDRAHAHLAVQEHHFDRVVQHLVVVLQTLGVESDVVEDVFRTLAPLKPSIVHGGV